MNYSRSNIQSKTIFMQQKMLSLKFYRMSSELNTSQIKSHSSKNLLRIIHFGFDTDYHTQIVVWHLTVDIIDLDRVNFIWQTYFKKKLDWLTFHIILSPQNLFKTKSMFQLVHSSWDEVKTNIKIIEFLRIETEKSQGNHINIDTELMNYFPFFKFVFSIRAFTVKYKIGNFLFKLKSVCIILNRSEVNSSFTAKSFELKFNASHFFLLWYNKLYVVWTIVLQQNPN